MQAKSERVIILQVQSSLHLKETLILIQLLTVKGKNEITIRILLVLQEANQEETYCCS
jgi:hypothetical protein